MNKIQRRAAKRNPTCRGCHKGIPNGTLYTYSRTYMHSGDIYLCDSCLTEAYKMIQEDNVQN